MIKYQNIEKTKLNLIHYLAKNGLKFLKNLSTILCFIFKKSSLSHLSKKKLK